ncbi:DUF4189 domain-containing protein [Stenotrophomonas sp. CASM112]|jgi:hypothetical protein|uniref:DUF4189 domain-containing protein n=2 Tax=unclassified Stenotrophomonas TaxID=196198 RepID=UPI003BF8E5A3
MTSRSMQMVVAAMLSLVFSSASAEGNCPPAMYPIGGQGVQGCAPIPGANKGGLTAPVSPPQPSGEWITTWGAIATSKRTSHAGVSTGQRRKSGAEQEALGKCASAGANDCKVMLAYFNQCAAWVVPSGRTGQGGSGIGRGPTLDVAEREAQKGCTNDQAGACEVFYTDCTKPIFKAY